ncbi:MAG: hypothetical protein IKK36_03120 [Bacteroidales bacterium]|nr:hypothetical protein [Bacteroidales bacterium]MBR3947254.1 hypothetical protein [Bacteroidales bacterium]
MKRLILILLLVASCSYLSAQSYGGYYGNSYRGNYFWGGEPARRYDYSNIWVSGGYQCLFHGGNMYHTGTIHAEYIFSFYGSRVGLTAGPDYFEFSPFGIILFAPAIFISTINDASLSDNPALLVFMLLAASASQWHIPIASHLEINLGWDGLKFVRMKNFEDHFYCTGSLNAGMTGWIGDHVFIQAYYEYNHTHNAGIRAIDWMFKELGGLINKTQPKYLNGHSFGVRLGWQFGY